MALEPADIQYLKRHLHGNNLVLFLGAGFSTCATNSMGEPLPSSRDLAKALWDYLGYDGPYDNTHLGIVYQAAIHKPGGIKNVFSPLTSILSVSKYPEWYRLITTLFWYRIYTTNVDNLSEQIYGDNGGAVSLQPVVAPCEYQDRDAFLKTIQLVKLTGSLDRPDLGLTFSPVEYGRRAAEQDVWYDHFVRDVSTHPTLFVGSELDDK